MDSCFDLISSRRIFLQNLLRLFTPILFTFFQRVNFGITYSSRQAIRKSLSSFCFRNFFAYFSTATAFLYTFSSSFRRFNQNLGPDDNLKRNNIKLIPNMLFMIRLVWSYAVKMKTNINSNICNISIYNKIIIKQVTRNSVTVSFIQKLQKIGLIACLIMILL